MVQGCWANFISSRVVNEHLQCAVSWRKCRNELHAICAFVGINWRTLKWPEQLREPSHTGATKPFLKSWKTAKMEGGKTSVTEMKSQRKGNGAFLSVRNQPGSNSGSTRNKHIINYYIPSLRPQTPLLYSVLWHCRSHFCSMASSLLGFSRRSSAGRLQAWWREKSLLFPFCSRDLLSSAVPESHVSYSGSSCSSCIWFAVFHVLSKPALGPLLRD